MLVHVKAPIRRGSRLSFFYAACGLLMNYRSEEGESQAGERCRMHFIRKSS